MGVDQRFVNVKGASVAYADDLDPNSSILAFYAKGLRRDREAAGLSQRELARRANMSPSLLNKVESGLRTPTEKLSIVADEVFSRGDHYKELWPLVLRYAYPPWFRPFVDLEKEAREIRAFEAQVVPGLLQTEDYTRAMLLGGRMDPDSIAERLALRRQRQLLLAKKKPPDLWVVLDENVLRRRVGSVEVMRRQLESLIEATETSTTVVQVVPYSAGGHAGIDGSFTILTPEEGSEVVAVEGFQHGVLLGEKDHVRAALRAYDLLTAVAISPEATIDMIVAIAKELA